MKWNSKPISDFRVIGFFVFTTLVCLGIYLYISSSEKTTKNIIDAESVCRAAISMIMGRPVLSITSRLKGGVVYTKYIRSNDHAVWENRCYLDGSRVVWSSFGKGATGRWRKDSGDSLIQFSVNTSNMTLKVSEAFSDGSKRDRLFHIKDLSALWVKRLMSEQEKSYRSYKGDAAYLHVEKDFFLCNSIDSFHEQAKFIDLYGDSKYATRGCQAYGAGRDSILKVEVSGKQFIQLLETGESGWLVQ